MESCFVIHAFGGEAGEVRGDPRERASHREDARSSVRRGGVRLVDPGGVPRVRVRHLRRSLAGPVVNTPTQRGALVGVLPVLTRRRSTASQKKREGVLTQPGEPGQHRARTTETAAAREDTVSIRAPSSVAAKALALHTPASSSRQRLII